MVLPDIPKSCRDSYFLNHSAELICKGNCKTLVPEITSETTFKEENTDLPNSVICHCNAT